jgi:hypothetical protein
MNIGHVGNNGGVDRSGDRPVRSGARDGGKASKAGGGDQAAISADGRAAAAVFDARVQTASSDGEDRADKVARAMQALMNGELDSEAVYRDVASRMLAGDFRAV